MSITLFFASANPILLFFPSVFSIFATFFLCVTGQCRLTEAPNLRKADVLEALNRSDAESVQGYILYGFALVSYG